MLARLTQQERQCVKLKRGFTINNKSGSLLRCRAQQLIQPDRPQLAFHDAYVLRWKLCGIVGRRVNSGVGPLCSVTIYLAKNSEDA
jgi:hypothetical protein